MEKSAILLGGRNDSYKEDERVLVCLESMIETFDEVWYCDWNTPKDKLPLLWELRDKLPKTGKIRHFVINEQNANILTNHSPKAGAFCSVLARNLMLRRCTADWVVTSTIDIIAPSKPKLSEFLANASKDTFYTVSRRDVEYNDLQSLGFDKWREFRDSLDKTSSPRYFPARVTPNDNYSLINCCGDFQLAHKNIWNTIKGFEENMISACFDDTNVQKKAVLNNFGLKAHYDLPLYHLSHTGMQNDGSSPTKQHYNDVNHWVEFFTQTENPDTWGFSDIDIEHEII